MNNNSFLPPLRKISHEITVQFYVVDFKKNLIFKGQYRTGAGAGDKIRGQVEPETK